MITIKLCDEIAEEGLVTILSVLSGWSADIEHTDPADNSEVSHRVDIMSIDPSESAVLVAGLWDAEGEPTIPMRIEVRRITGIKVL